MSGVAKTQRDGSLQRAVCFQGAPRGIARVQPTALADLFGRFQPLPTSAEKLIFASWHSKPLPAHVDEPIQS